MRSFSMDTKIEWMFLKMMTFTRAFITRLFLWYYDYDKHNNNIFETCEKKILKCSQCQNFGLSNLHVIYTIQAVKQFF